MRKQYFWLIYENATGRYVRRFRSKDDQLEYAAAIQGDCLVCQTVAGTHPEVRRIKHCIKAGEPVAFPVQIG